MGDIVQVMKGGEWLKEPATIIGKTDTDGRSEPQYDVRMGYTGGLTWGLVPDSSDDENDSEPPDPYASGMVLKGKPFPSEVRSGAMFKTKIEHTSREQSTCEKFLCCCCGVADEANTWTR